MPENSKNIQSDQNLPINQATLNAKMQLFLSCLGESFPNLKSASDPSGQCSGDSFMLFRADVIGERERYFKRKEILAASDDRQIKKMAALYRQYNVKHEKLREEKYTDLQTALEQNDQLASHLQKDPTEIRDRHYATIQNTARMEIINNLNLSEKNQQLLDFVLEFYYYIHSLIAAQEIQDFNLMDESETTGINQKDYLEILNLLSPDSLLSSPIEKTENEQKQKIIVPKKEFEFCLHFTESELIDTINSTIFPRDFVKLGSTNHAMYFRRIDAGSFAIFDFFDTNNEDSPPTIVSVEKLVKEIKERFFTNFKKDATWMLVYIQALNRESKDVRPTAEQLLDKIFEARGSESNVNALSSDGVSALYFAARQGCIDVVKNLLERGADVNQVDKDGISPLSIAVQRGYTHIVKLLLEQHADLNLISNNKMTLLYNMTLLNIAIRKGYTKIVKLLLEHHADPNLVDATRMTPLSLAIDKNRVEIVKLLLEHHADPNLADNTKTIPFSLAIDRNQVEIVKLLLEYHANPNLTDDYTTPPLSLKILPRFLKIPALFLAIKLNHTKIVETLLATKNIDLDAKNAEGATILYVATFAGNPEIIKMLLHKFREAYPDRWPHNFAEITKDDYIQDAIETIQKLNQLARDIKELPEESDPSRQMVLDALKKLAVDTWQNSDITFEFTKAYQKLQQAYEAFTKLDTAQLDTAQLDTAQLDTAQLDTAQLDTAQLKKINKSFSAIDYIKPTKKGNNDSIAEIKRMFEKAYFDNNPITEIKRVLEKDNSDNDSITEIKNALKKAYFDFATNPSRCESIVNELQNSLRCIYHEVVKNHKTSGGLRFFDSLQDKSTLQNLMEKAATQCNFDITMKSVSPVKRLSGST